MAFPEIAVCVATLSFKNGPQKSVGLRNSSAGCWCISQCVEHDEIVYRVVVSGRGDAHPGSRQSARVTLALIAQHVVLRNNHKRIWKPRQLINGGIERRCR